MITNNVAISESVQFLEGMIVANIENTTLNIFDSVISGNTASDSLVGIFGGTGNFRNVDIINNSMISVGGSYYDANTGVPVNAAIYGTSLTIEDSTISGNSSQTPFFSDGAVNAGQGAAVTLTCVRRNRTM